MNKKIIIPVVLLILTVITVAAGVNYFITQSNTKKTVYAGYYVEKGLDKFAKTTASAIENYLNQSSFESTDARNKRLSAFFTSDSQVYSYGLQNINQDILKTTAKVNSITSCEGEDGEICITAAADVTNYSKTDITTESQTYWISFIKNSKGEYSKANDIGMWAK